MPSAVAKGQHYKQRSQDWLIHHGYIVALLERMFSIWTPHGQRYVKQDQMGADLLAVSPGKSLFVQVKGGASWRSGLAAAREEFSKYPLAPGEHQVIMGWAPQAREPEIEVVAIGPQKAQHQISVPPRRKPKVLPLFARA